MDSAPNPLDELAADGRVHLAPNVTTTMAEDLRAAIVLATDHEDAIVIDASETESVGQAALQLLVAARLEADRLNRDFRIENAQPVVIDRIAALGLADLLGLSTEGKQDQ